MFFTLVYGVLDSRRNIVAAYLIADTACTQYAILSSKFKVTLCIRTNGVADEAIVIEWAVSSAS